MLITLRHFLYVKNNSIDLQRVAAIDLVLTLKSYLLVIYLIPKR